MIDVSDTWKHEKVEFVYKYCSWEVARTYVLSGPKTLRFSDIRTMNDLLEFSNLSIVLYGGKSDFDPLRYWTAIKKVTRNGIRYFCCTMDFPSDFNEATGFLQHSTVRGFDHPTMWNRYADKHEGVCLVLKKVNWMIRLKRPLF